jgi:mannose-6-phosphate isomerase-like protein (cupin superfamily)
MSLLKEILKEMPSSDIGIAYADAGNPEEYSPEEYSPEEEEDTVGFHIDIETDTTENNNFRKVIFTTEKTQLVLMSLKPGEEIGTEVHNGDQFFRFDAGEGQVIINGKEYTVKDGDAVVIPEGADHNVINTSDTEDLKLYALYSPPQHEDGTTNETKPEND